MWFIGAEERPEGRPRGAGVAAAPRGWLIAGNRSNKHVKDKGSKQLSLLEEGSYTY